MKLERRKHFPYLHDLNAKDVYIEYIWPLEEVRENSQRNWSLEPLPTEDGKLLLEFVKRHLFSMT